MIEVTMTFETAAEAADALARIAGTSNVAVEVAAGKPTKAEKAEAPKEEPAATTSSAKPSESAAKTAAEGPATISYDDLKKGIVQLAAKSPDTMRAICAEFGVKTFQGTPEDVWPKALKRVQEEIAKLG